MATANQGDAGTGKVWRGLGQRMYITQQGSAGGANWSNCYRSRHYSNVPFRYFRVVLQTFEPGVAAPFTDTDFATSFVFQVGFEYPYVQGNSGIPARIPVTFNAANATGYSPATGPFEYVHSDNLVGYSPATGPFGYILSDVIDAGQVIPAGAFFGFWTTQENAAGSASASNSLPYYFNATNYLERYEGYTLAASSLVAANTALTASSITHVSAASQAGLAEGVTPSMILIECDPDDKSVLMVGDSITYGVGEGVAGSGTNPNAYGDALGSVLSNAGYPARLLNEKFGYNTVNFGRGSDRLQYASANNWKYRLQMAALANPTHIVQQNLINDITSGSSFATLKTNLGAVYALLRGACPNIPIIQTTATPQAATTDAYVTTTNQTAGTGCGGPGSVRGQINDYIRSLRSTVNGYNYLDTAPILEDGYVSGIPGGATSLWNVTGVADGYTYDGTHPNSYADNLVANGLNGENPVRQMDY